MPKRVAILQSSYIPWKGYFDIIHDVDEFIFHDDVQYTRQDWRNRNRIKTPAGTAWLTIPVGGDERRRICDVPLPANDWMRAHRQRLTAAYQRAPFFAAFRPLLDEIYGGSARSLSELNQHAIRTIAQQLGLQTRFLDTRELALQGKKQERVLEILRQTGATTYVSGPAAQTYLDADRFAAETIELRWKDYAGYPEYEQLHPPFVHEVTILDLLFHTGPDAPRFIWGWRGENA
ncbi:MAG: WbqC family protein [Acidobacteria bacterium]|nr:WbqC family protein [Acidobacteriota bacterium]MBV9476217.1 WbqC family protein [Acidobacteriota bacterium]